MKKLLLTILLALVALNTFADNSDYFNLNPHPDSDDKKLSVKMWGDLDLRGVFLPKSEDLMLQGLNSGITAGLKGNNILFDYTKLTVNVDMNYQKNVEIFLQLQTRVIDGDHSPTNQIIGNNALLPFPNILQIESPLEQAYLKINDFLTSGLSIRAGEQNIKYSLRPGQDSFAFDLEGRASPFFGINTAQTAMRNFNAKSLNQPIGGKIRLDKDWWAIEAFDLAYSESVISGRDSIYGLFAEALPIPKLSLMGLITQFHSSEISDSGVWLAGGGVDYNVNEWLELFSEAYMNFGTLSTGIRKSGAYALNDGLHIQLTDKYWVEGAFSYATGDKNPADSEDNSFQSYGNVNTMLILQNYELGLGINTNYNALIFSFGAGPFEVLKGKNLLLHSDLGFFRFNQPLFSPAGAQFLADGNKNLGAEIDLGGTLEYNDHFSFFAKGGYLFDSNALRAITGTGSSAMIYIGTDIKF